MATTVLRNGNDRLRKGNLRKRPCVYSIYCVYSLAMFHCVLEGDLVFKLNPGPTQIQSNLAIRTHCSSTRRASQSTRTRNPFNLINVNEIPSTKQHYTPFLFGNKPLVTTTTTTNTVFRIPVMSLSKKRHPVQNKRSPNNRNLLSLNRCHGTSALPSNIDLNFCVINAQSLNNKAGEFIDFVWSINLI